jgi:alkylation response protein AidB-like acyl-CoA dehydrogenase
MYGFEPSDEQKMLVAAIQKYATKDLRQAAHDADEEGGYPPEVVRRGWELGVLQASIPEAYGGFGERSAVTGVLAAEELAWGDLAGALAIMSPGTFALPTLAAGTEEQKKRWLPGIVEGDWRPYVAAITEPNFDYGADDLRTTATRQNGSYLLDGQKCLVPFADAAEAFLVFARLGDRAQAFYVPRGVNGMTLGEREQYCGLGSLPTYRLTFEKVLVPAADRLGGENGFDSAPLLAAANTATAALAVGLGRAAYEYALAYAKEREVFGKPIGQKQSIAFGLAEMAIEIEAIRLLVWEAAWLLDAGKDAAKAAYLALTGASDLAMMVTDRAVQYLGGHGYIREHPVERWMRNGRGIAVFPGLAMV